jgi:hypothetical protein
MDNPMTPAELLNALGVRIYEQPLSEAREHLLELPEPLRVVMLAIDFNTEVLMEGILGFLENSTGLYLQETIDAFQVIGATHTAGILIHIAEALRSCGVSPSDFRADFANARPGQVTTFIELHGEARRPMADAVGKLSNDLYFYHPPGQGEDAMGLLEEYISRTQAALLAAIEESGVQLS